MFETIHYRDKYQPPDLRAFFFIARVFFSLILHFAVRALRRRACRAVWVMVDVHWEGDTVVWTFDGLDYGFESGLQKAKRNAYVENAGTGKGGYLRELCLSDDKEKEYYQSLRVGQIGVLELDSKHKITGSEVSWWTVGVARVR